MIRFETYNLSHPFVLRERIWILCFHIDLTINTRPKLEQMYTRSYPSSPSKMMATMIRLPAAKVVTFPIHPIPLSAITSRVQ